MITTISEQRINPSLARAAAAAPLLEKQEELSLAPRWRDQRDPEALEKLMTSYLRLVISMASKYRHYGLPANDLVQEGCMGLIQAADRFEPERNLRFSTYASWWIKAAIQDFVLRNWSIVRTGTTASHKKLFFNLRRMRSLVGQQTQNDSAAPIAAETRERIAGVLGVKCSEVDYMEVRLIGSDPSFNAPISANNPNEVHSNFPDDKPSPEDIVMHDNDCEKRHAWLNDAMDTLNEREQLIIRRRRLSEDIVTLAVLGVSLGVSKERVRQIEQQALKKLKKSLIQAVGDPAACGLIPSA